MWEYRQKVHDLVVGVIKTTDLTGKIDFEKIKTWVVFMGMEHERIHLETSSVLIRELDIKYVKKPAPDSHVAKYVLPTEIAPSRGRAPLNEMITVDAGTTVLGKPWSYPTYGWDNEYGVQQVKVPSFQASKFKITNGEWLAFINAKGYERQELWDEEGWGWVTYTKARHPHFWVALDQSKYMFRTIFDIIEMPWDWPVEVNFLEAAAYCRWKGKGYRPITEAEWHRITGITHPSSEGELKDHNKVQFTEEVLQQDPALNPNYKANLDFSTMTSTPVDEFPPNALGFYDAFGNVWEWSSTPYDALPGFRTCYIYQDFSTPCFDGRHNMILGGSWASTGNETSLYARYAFRRHFFQHAGFRLVRSLETDDIYETPKLRREYLFFHFAEPKDLMPWAMGPQNGLCFPKDCADLLISTHRAQHSDSSSSSSSSHKKLRALDVGCAVGRSTFELVRYAEHAVGIDYSHSFIDAANDLKEKGETISSKTLEGHITQDVLIKVDPSIDRSRVDFYQGDAHRLDFDRIGQDFDLVLAANLIDRLVYPRHFIDALPRMVAPGGVLLITSPYTWLEQFTPKEEWLGGFVDPETNLPVHTFDTLKRLLSDSFELIEARDLPFVIYEHSRKYQWSAAHATLWLRKSL